MKALSAVGLLSAFVYFFLPFFSPATNIPTCYNRMVVVLWALPIFLEHWWPETIASVRRSSWLFRLSLVAVVVMMIWADVRAAGFPSPYIWFDFFALLSWGEVVLGTEKEERMTKGHGG